MDIFVETYSVSRSLTTGLGIDFWPGVQEGLISDRGSDMIHEIGVSCAKCRTADVHANMLRDGQSQTRLPNCRVCSGDGWIFRDPILVRGLATNIRQQNNVIDVGVVQPGDMQFSLPSSFASCGKDRKISKGDKFTQTWPLSLDDGQTIIRGAATLGENIRLIDNINENEDRLWYEPVSSMWCEDENGVIYKEGSDFTLGPGRVIMWVGSSPIVGSKYVIKYSAYFEWLVFAPPFERVDKDNRDLGPLVFLRKRHVAFINESPYITSSDRQSFSKRIAC